MPIVMYKKIGETPLECLTRLRLERPEYAQAPANMTGVPGVAGVGVPLTYVGRLDPMAEGALLVLAGEDCKDRAKYLELEKEYICEILWGYATDTYDILGKVKRMQVKNVSISELKNKLEIISQKLVGKMQQKYPPYSSKPVRGKPLLFWAREGRLDEIKIPSKEIEVKVFEVLDTKSVSPIEIEKDVMSRLSLARGDFRQAEIIPLWKTSFENLYEDVLISKIRVVCSSGTYVRGLVEEMGKAIGLGATVLSLVRTRVGDYKTDQVS